MSRSFRFLILNTDYGEFLTWLYSQNPGLEGKSYEKQMHARMESLFGVADFYSSNLRKLGHHAWDIHANNEFMQKAWARANGIRVEEPMAVSRQWQKTWQIAQHAISKLPLRYMRCLVRPLFRSLNGQPTWLYDILAAQIRHYKPDVLLNQDMAINSRFLREMKPYVRLLVGQHAATRLRDSEDWACYDLVVSSFLPTVEFFRQRGIRSEVSRLCFEPRVLSRLPRENRTFDITFVGSFHSVHRSRTAFLEVLSVRFPQLRIWGPGINWLPSGSPIQKCYMGQAWGREMYQILRRSKIVINHHGNTGPYANNFRLYEATGVGTLLVTDWKLNLSEIFEPGREVVVYQTPEECAELIRYYLEHDDEREAIAREGQRRTLQEHTYYHRVQEMISIIRHHV